MGILVRVLKNSRYAKLQLLSVRLIG